MPRVSVYCVLVCLLALGTARLEAGVLIVSNQESLVEPKHSSTHKIYIDKDRLRLETGEKETQRIVIFRHDQEKFWLIDPTNKTYTEVTKQDLRTMKNQLDGAMAMMQDKLKALPAEQRKMLEQMLQSKMPAARPEVPKTLYKKVASGEKVNQWLCDKYAGSGTDKEELWTTDWHKTGITADDLKVVQHMGAFVSELTKDQSFLTHFSMSAGEKERGYAGFPVRLIQYSGTQARSKMDIKDIQQQQFTAALFELPGGLQKKAMMP